MASVDVCVVGHVTRDRIRVTGQPEAVRPGGAAWYAAWTLAGLGARVRLVTRMAARDVGMLAAARERMNVQVVEARCTTTFDNRYDERGHRTQQVHAVAEPWDPNLLPIDEVGAWFLGPLTPAEMSLDVLGAVVARRAPVALDLQGLVRDLAADPVGLQPLTHPERWLAGTAVVKADASEAWQCTGESAAGSAARRLREMGASEALVTLGAEGVWLAHAAGVTHVPAVFVAEPVDPTGCGDTFLAAYLWARLAGEGAERAARFAVAAAALKLERTGPLLASPDEVAGRL